MTLSDLLSLKDASTKLSQEARDAADRSYKASEDFNLKLKQFVKDKNIAFDKVYIIGAKGVKFFRNTNKRYPSCEGDYYYTLEITELSPELNEINVIRK